MPRNRQPAVYILTSQRNGTLYIGITSNLVQRVWQHRQGLAAGFTNTHGVKTLVWYELHETMDSAITREKALKKWNRQEAAPDRGQQPRLGRSVVSHHRRRR